MCWLVQILPQNQNILAVKVQYSNCSKFDDFRPAILIKQHFKLKIVSRVVENVSQTMNKDKLGRSDNWFRSYEP
jgi:hypothetical protein